MGDLISRTDITEMLVDFYEKILALPTFRCWIPCSIRLPKMVDEKLLGDYDNSDPCFVTVKHHDRVFVLETSAVYCSDGKWRYGETADCWKEIDDQVLAYIPLPEPYKEQ